MNVQNSPHSNGDAAASKKSFAWIKHRIHLALSMCKKRLLNPKAVFLVLTPAHRNLGDHAIAYAEQDFFKKKGISYIEITGSLISELYEYDLLHTMNGYPIYFQGGGYLGTLWFESEILARTVILKNPKSKVVFLPNTIFYESSDWGRAELEKSKDIYNSHPNITFYAREKTSYDFMKPIYRDVRLMPDMVLSLPHQSGQYRRSGCLLCLRNDCEKTRSEEQERIIREQAAVLFGNSVRDTDMLTQEWIPPERREQELQKKFTEFAKAELVITDRLHGMIFCAITGTTCIVVDSKSPKVRGCYEWIKNLDYIRFVDDVSNISDEYAKIPQGKYAYDNAHLQHYYDELIEVVKSYAHN